MLYTNSGALELHVVDVPGLRVQAAAYSIVY